MEGTFPAGRDEPAYVAALDLFPVVLADIGDPKVVVGVEGEAPRVAQTDEADQTPESVNDRRLLVDGTSASHSNERLPWTRGEE
jgi:hypothetical protein